MRKILCLLSLMLCASKMYAVSQDSVYKQKLYLRPLTASLNLGTTGIGAEAKLGILQQVNARLGFNVLPVGYSKDNFRMNGTGSDIKMKTTFANIHLLGEYRPFKKSSFRVVAGVAYFLSGDITVDLQPTGTFSYGEIPLTKDDIGKVKGTISWRGLAPYLGVGLFNSLPQRKFNVTMDLGTYYLAKPDTKIEGTGLLVDNDQNEAQLNENLKQYRWMPQLQVNFNYRIR